MIFHALALAAEIARCAPGVALSTMTGIVRVESGGDPYAIGDNTARRSYHPSSRASAEEIAGRLMRLGHSVDLGIAQINSANLPAVGLDDHTIFDPCENLAAGARILAGDIQAAASRFGPGPEALRHALGMYNTGRLDRGEGYARRVLLAAGNETVPDPGTAPVADAASGPLLVPVRRASAGHRQVGRPRSAATAPIMVAMPGPGKIVEL